MKVQPQQSEPDAPSVVPERHWYGAQVLLSDAVSLSVFGTGLGLTALDGSQPARAAAPSFIWAGVLGYAIAPATIHVLHSRPAIAFASTTLRVAIPIAGAFLGANLECPITTDMKEKCSPGAGPWLGLSAGFLFASVIDVGYFSYDAPTEETRAAVRFDLVPYVSSDGKRAELRAFGTF